MENLFLFFYRKENNQMSTLSNQTESWEEYRKHVLDLAGKRNDEAFMKYISSLTERAWKHVLEENKLTHEQAEKTMWSFYEEDKKNREER
jgi:predicted phosphoadenosine phosphosulfate sulfurtransferase